MKNEAGLVLTGKRVLVKLGKLEEKTVGGIVLATQTKEAEERAQTTGELIDAAELAWNEPEMKGIKTGDTVFFAKYAGANVDWFISGVNYRTMNASDIIAKVEQQKDSKFQAARSSAETFGVNTAGSDVKYGT
jgi:chaperonin GroES